MTTNRVVSSARSHQHLLPRQPHPQPSRQFLRELPGDAAGARAARGRPFQRLAFKLVFGELDAEMAAIALHHGQVLVLAAAVKAEPKSKTVRQRDFLLDR